MKPAALNSTSTANTARRFFLAARVLTALALAAVIVPGTIPAAALAATPQVTNVIAVQRSGTKLVDVTYDVFDADGHAMTIALYISPDGGLSFPVHCLTVTGDVGAGVLSGTGRHIVWDARADYPGHVGETYAPKVTADDGQTPDMVLVPAGTFTMGSPTSEPGRQTNETQHQVTLTHAMYVSKYEVKQSEWQAVMGWNLSSFPGVNRPVEMVTWYDAIAYCNQRSTGEGLTAAYAITGAIYSGVHITSAAVAWNQAANGYRLLTEAEWEYACRATSTTAFCNGAITNIICSPLDPNLDQVGWYCGNASSVTHDVGGKTANAWGLKDMHGNVWEWCWDWYGTYPTGPLTDPTGPASGSSRVLRGGSWNYSARTCRSARRYGYYPGDMYYGIGLRLSRTAP